MGTRGRYTGGLPGGIRAAHGVFLLRLMGYPDARNYDASWSEWGNVEDTPITTD